MQLSSKVSMAFKRAKAVDQVTFGNSVIVCLSPVTMLADYPNLPVPVAELQTINNNLNDATTAVQTTDSRQAKTTLKNARKAWIEAFGITGAYISMVAGGNDETIAAAGYLPTRSSSQPTQKPELASSFQASINGFKGAILAGTKVAVPEAAAYVYYALPAGATVSFSENTMILTVDGKSIYINVATQKKTEIYNLPNCVPFNVGMYAINRAGAGPATALQQVVTQ